MINVKIAQLFTYPVKSLAGISIDATIANRSGVKFDRQWSIVQPNGRPLTQRQEPMLSQIFPRLENDVLFLKNAQGEEIQVEDNNDEELQINVWKDICYGKSASKQVNNWITASLGSSTPLKLVHLTQNSSRVFDNTQRFSIEGNYFSDAAPYLLVNQSSLDELNSSLADLNFMVDIRRFRPNIVLSGLSPFTELEYQWLGTEENPKLFELIDHCSRCAVITVDPITGEKDPKSRPFKALAKLNSMPDNHKIPAFGVNTVLRSTSSLNLKVGDNLILKK